MSLDSFELRFLGNAREGKWFLMTLYMTLCILRPTLIEDSNICSTPATSTAGWWRLNNKQHSRDCELAFRPGRHLTCEALACLNFMLSCHPNTGTLVLLRRGWKTFWLKWLFWFFCFHFNQNYFCSNIRWGVTQTWTCLCLPSALTCKCANSWKVASIWRSCGVHKSNLGQTWQKSP